MNSSLTGRCLALSASEIRILTRSGPKDLTLRASSKEPMTARIGDIVEVSEGRVRVLTANRRPDGRMDWTHRIQDPRRRRGLAVRSQVEGAIREFFESRGFLETRTPLLVPSPGMEPHIRPFRAQGLAQGGGSAFLPTSPEFAMKRLLVGGLDRIFQLSPAFRDEPRSSTHEPEFTMLEWYRAYAGYEDIQRDSEELFAAIGRAVGGKPELTFQGRRIDLTPPWPRLRVRDLFLQHAGVNLVAANTGELLAAECRRLGIACDLARDTWDDLYFRIWLNRIEPLLPAERAVFVTRYPASQAALAVVDSDSDGSRWARRFEVYAGGLELGNAFEELTDPVEQRRRFVEDMDLRARAYGPEFPKSPLDEEFLEALEEGLPPSGGIAMGVDRIVMLFADEPEIAYTRWL